ncbi:hypothetical protein BDV37DRAFT_272869 [Aspergillus pseudonomiae]|uniref:Uncharacterized protein n=1 Tax=Aspergillus pseudonomiae TaxID=1506151 RepID=A0A5N7D7K2_9EURO|nr:uncharacterized protein BDV37DRAFT_272869 [Aspergillus pseudonomiae]KAE8402401.1 hypothetical protein BDV37DRAFT_272869 [Aspergillus pseudonomiae]
MTATEDPDLKKWLPDLNLIVKVNGTPNDQPKSQDVFVLSHPKMVSLMQYVYAGALLPTTTKNYCNRMQIEETAIPSDVKEAMSNVLVTYSKINTECTGFSQKTWPDMVTLAARISDYCEEACGKGNIDGAFYVQLLKLIGDYNDLKKSNADKKQIDQKASDVKDYVEEFKEKLKDLSDQSTKMRDALNAFKGKCSTNQQDLDSEAGKVQKMLTDKNGAITKIRDEIKKAQNDLRAAQEEYKHDVIVASTTPAYAWCTIFGFIAAITTASIYGSKAVAMRKAIERIEGLIKKDEEILKADVAIDGDLTRMKADLQTIIDLIGPAIEILGSLITVWQQMSDHLDSISNQIDLGQTIRGVALERAKLNNVVTGWKEMQAKVDTFRNTAYIQDTKKVMTIKEWIDNSNKSSPSA